MSEIPRYANAEDIEKNWRDAVDRARVDGKPLITTLESFARDGDLLHRSLVYARAQGVDVMIAAESDATFF